LEAEINHRELKNVSLAGRYSAQAMPDLFRRADVLLVSLSGDPALARTIPSKVQTYLASGRPILAILEGEGARILREAGAGLVVAPGDAAALADAVRQLAALSASELEKLGASGRNYFSANFSNAQLTAALVETLSRAAQQEIGLK
jgi:glycosyltransferase involved in cell wall biosynthesis